jgi:heptosyltransferase III
LKILILKRDKLGDLLLTTPMLRVLRQALPTAQVHLLASDYSAWVVEGNTDIDVVHAYPRTRTGRRVHPLGVLRQAWQMVGLRRAHFDFAIAAGGDDSHRAIKRALMIGAARTVAYTDNRACYPRLTHPVPVDDGTRTRHEASRMCGLLQPLLGPGYAIPDPLPLPSYVWPEASLAFARAWLAHAGVAPGGHWVLGLGARRAKRQPSVPQVLALAEHAFATFGLNTVLMWTPGSPDDPLYPGDDHIAEPVLAAKLPFVLPFRGPLREALGLVRLARTSLFPDSGLMHFAAASPGGVIGLFADIDNSPSPAQWGPLGLKSKVVIAERAVSELPEDTLLLALDEHLRASV